MLQLVDQALKFAAQAHRNQIRKDVGQTPYIYHPVMCGFYLMMHGMAENLVVAAILHDVVEDTETSLEDIKEHFGLEVHDLVKCQTENKSLSWEERKQGQLDGILHYPVPALFVKLADKLHNISCTYQEKLEGRPIFTNMNRGLDKQSWYFQGLVRAFEQRPEILEHPMFQEFKQKVEYVFSALI